MGCNSKQNKVISCDLLHLRSLKIIDSLSVEQEAESSRDRRSSG